MEKKKEHIIASCKLHMTNFIYRASQKNSCVSMSFKKEISIKGHLAKKLQLRLTFKSKTVLSKSKKLFFKKLVLSKLLDL